MEKKYGQVAFVSYNVLVEDDMIAALCEKHLFARLDPILGGKK